MKQKKSSFFLCLLLLLFSCVLIGCNGTHDNSPDQYKPDGSNGNSSFDTTGMPQFNLQPGVYTDAIVVELTCSDPSYTIRYTTDCSTPTASSDIYTEPFPMQYSQDSADGTDVCTFNIRAASFDQDGNMIGRVVSASYLFPASEGRFTTKVVSIVTDDNNLNKRGYGILSNPYGKGRDWERPVNFQLYGVEGGLLVQQDLGIRVNGTGSRSNSQKNFRLYARKVYSAESGHLNYALFPGLLSEYTEAQIEAFDTFLLRGGASNFHNSMITNLVAYEMMQGSSVTVGAYEPAALYLNGKYYGLMMLIEDYNPYFFESHYGVDEQKVTTINYTVLDEGGLGWEYDDCTDEEKYEFSAARHWVEDNDMSDSQNYARACEVFDMQNFIEYLVLNCYVNNWDWPRNNVRVWRYNGVTTQNSLTGKSGGYDADAAIGWDGRWRFTVKDLDVSMGLNVKPSSNYWSKNDVDFFEVLFKDGRVSSASTMFASLIKNKSFAKDFFCYLTEFMSTRADVDTYLETINKLSLQVSEEMKYHSAQYKDTLSTWDKHLECMREFAQVRPGIVLKSLKNNKYDLPNIPEIAEIDFRIGVGGSVSFNGGTFSGDDHAYAIRKTDLVITPVPNSGYVLSEIEIDGGSFDDYDSTVYLRSDKVTITVTFTAAENSGSDDETQAKSNHLVLNEIGHSSIEKVNGSDWVELYNPTDADINLKGWTITNGMESYSFPSIYVPAGGFKVIFLAGTDQGGVYAPFTIGSGDTLAISDAKGNLIDSVSIYTKASTSHLGRYPDGGEWVELSRFHLTPNEPNFFEDGFSHYYDERVQNTIMVNGYLLENEVFSVSESGSLTTTKQKLQAITGISSKALDALLNFFSDYSDTDVIDIAEWIANHPEEADGHIYYVEALNSYVCHI